MTFWGDEMIGHGGSTLKDGDTMPCPKCGERTIMFYRTTDARSLFGKCSDCDHEWWLYTDMNEIMWVPDGRRLG